MSNAKMIVNELLVDIFNEILSIESRYMKKKDLKLSINEIHVLEAIKKVKPSTMTKVAGKLKISQGTLTTSIHTLVRKKYVLREKPEEDRRIVKLFLTQKAEDALKIHDEFHREMIDLIFKDLKIGEDELLINSLSKVSEYFKNKRWLKNHLF